MCQLQSHTYADMTYGDLGGDSSGDSLNLLSLLVSNESRHSLDSLLLSDLLFRQLKFSAEKEKGTHLLLLDVNLDELDTWVLLFHLGEVGRDHFAWSTPSCPEVDNNGLVTVDLGISLFLHRVGGRRTRALNSSYDSIALTIVICV
jgi:hypothetical protein